MGALKVRKVSYTRNMLVIKADEGQSNFFEVDENENILYLGSNKDGFTDSETIGEVIDAKCLSVETRRRIEKWFKR